MSGNRKLSAGAGEQDQSVVLASGAILAEQTKLVFTSDVKERAETSASQTNLATSSEGFLMTRSPIAAGDAVKRGISQHTVTSGETISSIAGKYGITSETVMWTNNLTETSALKAGQQIIILPISGLVITASGGESVENLAATYKANPNLIDSYSVKRLLFQKVPSQLQLYRWQILAQPALTGLRQSLTLDLVTAPMAIPMVIAPIM